MEWELELIDIYLKVCDMWEQGVWTSVQRFSNNKSQALTDQEVITMYLFGCVRGHNEMKEIHRFCNDFLRSFFPQLMGYDGFCYRLRVLADAFVAICEKLVAATDAKCAEAARKLVDSMPIILAGSRRSGNAKVAPDVAKKGYCASKGLYYYGVKLHIIGFDRDGRLPLPTMIGMSAASDHDLPVFKQAAPTLTGCDIFADSAYSDRDFNRELERDLGVTVATPIKRKKGQTILDAADRLYSSAVSSIRQPIESLFNWLNEKTNIQKGSKVRSTKGLMVHVFGKLCAGILMLSKQEA